MAVVGDKLATPETGWKRYDDDNGSLGFIGTWTKNSSSALANAYTKTLMTTGVNPNNYLEFTFIGTAFRIIGIVITTNYTKLRIEIDGEEFIGNNQSAVFKDIALIFEKTGLENKVHNVKVYNIGDTGQSAPVFWFDAIDIPQSAELLRYDYLDSNFKSEYDRKYLVAQYSFDESSSNVFERDELTPLTGVVSGATRVNGWNGKGKALNFNGTSDHVNFSSRVVPVGEKSIRFKIKINARPTETMRVLSTSRTDSENGLIVAILSTGLIYFKVTNGVNFGALYIESSVDICDNKWHDILFTWDGTTNAYGVKLYVDDMQKPNKQNKAVGLEPVATTSNLRIGAITGALGHYLKGQLDDLEIYNKAVDVNVLPFVNPLFHKSDDTILSLSVSSSKIKDIRLKDENIKKGSNILSDIDYATDRQEEYDLERACSEYEIISDKAVTSNRGKQFEIPIPRAFKTIKI